MNQIQEKDWAEESWHSHTGIDSSCDYCIIDETTDEQPEASAEATADKQGADKGVKKPKNDRP